MKFLSLSHIIFLLVTLAFFVVGFIVMQKLSRKVQKIVIYVLTFICCAGIFYRATIFNYGGKFHIEGLLLQMLQVCNFNFILLPLALIKKNELARQYCFYFSMAAAFTTFVSPSSAFANLEWYNFSIINSWINHTLAFAVPLFMAAARISKPEKKYILPVLGLVFVYFGAGYGIQSLFISKGILTVERSFSFIFRQEGNFFLEWLYSLIPYPFLYLLPLAPFLGLFFWLLSLCFNKYQVDRTKKPEISKPSKIVKQRR